VPGAVPAIIFGAPRKTITVMSQERTDLSSPDPYADEPTVEESIEEMVTNADGRWVLIAPDLAKAAESALFYDTKDRMISYIDEGDELHRQVVKRMLIAGARVFASCKEANAAARPAT
jgi:hypothetical protein